MAYASIVANVIGLFAGIIIGPIFDVFGRKTPLLIVMICASSAVGIIPLFKSFYPWFVILRCISGFST